MRASARNARIVSLTLSISAAQAEKRRLLAEARSRKQKPTTKPKRAR